MLIISRRSGRQMLEREDLARELPPLRVVQQELPLWAYVPQTPTGFDCSAETWVLNGDGPRVSLDLVPQVVSFASESAGLTEEVWQAGAVTTFLPGDPPYPELIDLDRLYAELV